MKNNAWFLDLFGTTETNCNLTSDQLQGLVLNTLFVQRLGRRGCVILPKEMGTHYLINTV